MLDDDTAATIAAFESGFFWGLVTMLAVALGAGALIWVVA